MITAYMLISLKVYVLFFAILKSLITNHYGDYRCPNFQILGDKLQSKSGKEEGSVAYRVWNENASTAQLTTVADLTGTVWSLTKMRCAAHHQIGSKSPRGHGHTVAVAVRTEGLLQGITMTSGVMTATKMGIGIVIEIETEILSVIETDIPPTEETTIDDDDTVDVLDV